MKFIKLKHGRGVYHLSFTDEISTLYYTKAYTYCRGNAAVKSYGDHIEEKPPEGRFCPRCKKKYIKNFSEEELFLELM